MRQIVLHVNGRDATVALDDAAMPLLYALRDDLGLRGPKFGCGLGQCGACAVLIDGQPVRSCLIAAADVGEGKIVTLEGLGSPEAPSHVQAAFIALQAGQCAYCANGMIVAATALLAETPHPTEAEVRGALGGYLCRCGAHARIVAAVLRAAGGA